MKRTIWAGALAAIFCLLPARAEAAETEALPPPAPEAKHSDRFLGDHLFSTSLLVPSPFILTRLSLRQGVGEFKAEDYPFTRDYREDVSLVGVSDTLNFGVRLFGRLELFLQANGQVLTGTDIRPILALGSDYSYSGGGGAAFRILRLDSTDTQLTVRARGTVGTGGSLDILTLVDTVAESPAQTAVDVVRGKIGRVVLKDTWRTEVAGHVTAAQEFHRNFGLQAALGLYYTSFEVEGYDAAEDADFDITTDDVNLDGSIALDANMFPIAPVGFLLEYSMRERRRELASTSDDASGLTHLLSVGAHYLDDRFQAGLAAVQVLGLQPLTRTTVIGNETLESGDTSFRYIELSLHANW